MIKPVPVCFLLVSLIGCSEQGDFANIHDEAKPGEKWEDLIVEDGLVCTEVSKLPYSGWTKSFYSNNAVYVFATFEKGLLTQFKRWRRNGSEQLEVRFSGLKVEQLEDLFSLHKGRFGNFHYDPEFLAKGEKVNVLTLDELKFREFDLQPCAKHGAFRQWHEDGKIMKEIHFVDGLLDGKWTSWSKDGIKIHEIHFLEGKLHGPHLSWFNRDGVLMREEGYFLNGFPDGSQKTWYANGTIRLHANYSGGLRHGEFSTWHENGKLKEKSNYLNGKLDGFVVLHYPDGRAKETASYRNGRRHGMLKRFHDNGVLMNQWVFNSGKYHGPWLSFYRTGEKKTRRRYNNGRLESAKVWTPKGREVSECVEDGNGTIVLFEWDGTESGREFYVDGRKVGN